MISGQANGPELESGMIDDVPALRGEEVNELGSPGFALSPGSNSTSSDLKGSNTFFDLLGLFDSELEFKQFNIQFNKYINNDIEMEDGAYEGALEGSGEHEMAEPFHSHHADATPDPSNGLGLKSSKVLSAYECGACGEKFTNRRVYGCHVSQVHGAGAFICERCGATFTRPDNLKTHRRTCEKRRPLPGKKRAADDLSEPQIVPSRAERKRVNIQDLKTPPASFHTSRSTGIPITPADSPVPISSALVVSPISPCGAIRSKGSLENKSAQLSGGSDAMHQTQNIPYLGTGSPKQQPMNNWATPASGNETRHVMQFLSDRVNILEAVLGDMRESCSTIKREKKGWKNLYLNLDKEFHVLQNENSDLRSQLIQLRTQAAPVDKLY